MRDISFGIAQILVAALVAFYAYRRKSLKAVAAIGGIVLSVLLYVTGGTVFLTTMLVFFLSSSILTKTGKKAKEQVDRYISAHAGARDIVQVAANGSAALVLAVLYWFTRSEIAMIGFFAAFAASNADTWASEVGTQSSRVPVSILTFKPIEKGLSGGVTLLGTLASVAGAAVIAAVYFLYRLPAYPVGDVIVNSAVIIAAGFFGSLADSYLGATLQAKYLSEETGKLTEKPFSLDRPNRLVRGFRLVNNDLVNFLSSSFAALLPFLIR